MTEEFKCDFQEFKERASAFFKRLKELPVLTRHQLDAGEKGVGLSYLNMTGTENEVYQAGIVLSLMNKASVEYIINNNIE